MERKEFKKIINECLLLNNFTKRGSYYFKDSAEIICSIGLQKSNYSNCYYINMGIVIKEINKDLIMPRDVDGDIRCRFTYELNGEEVDCFDLDKIERCEVVSVIDKGISEIINIALEKGLIELLRRHPMLLYSTTIKGRQYLGLEK